MFCKAVNFMLNDSRGYQQDKQNETKSKKKKPWRRTAQPGLVLGGGHKAVDQVSNIGKLSRDRCRRT
jgi:hypothetical protein